MVVVVVVVAGGGVSCGVGWKGGVLLLVFAVETWARKGRRNAGGKREGWEEDWMKARRMIGASIFVCFWGVGTAASLVFLFRALFLVDGHASVDSDASFSDFVNYSLDRYR